MTGLVGPEERPEGTARIYFEDNTYKTLALTNQTTVDDVIQLLCKRIVAAGRKVDPNRHELLIIAPGNQNLRESVLHREDKLLQIQAKGGAAAFKFLFREVCSASMTATEEAKADAEVILPFASAANGMLRTGQLELLLRDGIAWQPCTAILDADHFWYAPVTSREEASAVVGNRMNCLYLRHCDRVLEDEDICVFQILSKEGDIKIRTKNNAERSAWLLSVVKQVALVKEQDIMIQAERAIAAMEVRRSGAQLAQLEAFDTLQGLLAGRGEAQKLLLWFLNGEIAAGIIAQEAPAWDNAEDLLAELENQNEEAVAFVESALLPRFRSDPQIQSRLCRIAAGVACTQTF